MKLSFAIVTLCSAAMVACTHSSSSSGGTGVGVLGQPMNQPAMGAVNGTQGQFSTGSYVVSQDSKGNPTYQITLGLNGVATCNTFPAQLVEVIAPMKVGSYAFPAGLVDFVYTIPNSMQNDISGNDVINIISDDGQTLTGSVNASMNASGINGTFAVTKCLPPGTSVTPTPVPSDPSQVQAIPATTWGEVKYAFCSAQGQYGVLIDFQGTDLSSMTSGKAQIAMRACDGSTAFEWGAPVNFLATSNNNSITLDFGASTVVDNSENTIQIGNNAFTNGYGIFDGNSGPCTLLTNEGTQGLYDQDPNFSCR